MREFSVTTNPDEPICLQPIGKSDPVTPSPNRKLEWQAGAMSKGVSVEFLQKVSVL